MTLGPTAVKPAACTCTPLPGPPRSLTQNRVFQSHSCLAGLSLVCTAPIAALNTLQCKAPLPGKKTQTLTSLAHLPSTSSPQDWGVTDNTPPPTGCLAARLLAGNQNTRSTAAQQHKAERLGVARGEGGARNSRRPVEDAARARHGRGDWTQLIGCRLTMSWSQHVARPKLPDQQENTRLSPARLFAPDIADTDQTD